MSTTYHELMDLLIHGADIEVSAAKFRFDELAEAGSKAKKGTRITVRQAQIYDSGMRLELVHLSRSDITFSFD